MGAVTIQKPSNQRLQVAIVAAEAVPFAQAGGLGDVIGALPLALERLGVDVRVLIPAHRPVNRVSIEEIGPLEPIAMGTRKQPVSLWQSQLPNSSIPVYLVSNPAYFDRSGIYTDPVSGEGYPDNLERFAFFCKAVFPALQRVGFAPDVLHANDSQTALAIVYLQLWYRQSSFFAPTGSLYTIHNVAYQEVYSFERFAATGLPFELTRPGGPFEFFGQFNLMKAAISYADVISTVSRQYAREIQSEEFGYRLEGVLQQRSSDLYGVLNGCDYNRWNPHTDALIPFRYGPDNLTGKARDKEFLQRKFNLPLTPDVPVVGIISRLADQKGFDLVLEAIDQILSLPLQMVLLGTGQRRYQDAFEQVGRRYPDRFGLHLGFNESLAHLIEAGSDLFLMPSRYEPCGLNQMYSLKYGTVPVVRHTGGLADTVADFDPATGQGNGFKFYLYHSQELVAALRRALDAYRDPEVWNRIRLHAMKSDFSWDASAAKYLELYAVVRKKRQSLD